MAGAKTAKRKALLAALIAVLAALLVAGGVAWAGTGQRECCETPQVESCCGSAEDAVRETSAGVEAQGDAGKAEAVEVESCCATAEDVQAEFGNRAASVEDAGDSAE